MESTTHVIDPRQAELQQLQREYRHMELNRRAYSEESQALLRKQQSTIDKMRKDNDAIKQEIALIMRSSNKPQTSSQQSTIQKLHDQGDLYANTIEYERGNIQNMEEQIQIMKQKVLHQRRAMGGINASKDNHFMIQKQIRILENRLDKGLIKFNEAISHNKTLRDTIDDLRRERVVFENIYKKMERELQDRKQQMAEIIELSNQSYEQRDTYQMEVAAIEQANRKEQEEFEEQMIELGRMLENELKLPSGRSPTATFGRRTGDTMNSDDTGFKPGTAKSGFGTGTGGGSDGISFERIQNFEEAFSKIKAATGITDIEELVRTFIKNEDHNFSLFNYVNEQNNEIEKYDEQIQVLREEERKFAQESGEDVHQHKQILKELESKLQSTEAMAEKYEMKCQDLQRTIESLKRGIKGIYEKFDMDEEGFGDPLVTESNMAHYLGLIEQKTNQFIQSYSDVRTALLKPAEKEEDSPSKLLFSVLGSGPKVPMGQDLLHVNPPKLDDYQSDDEGNIFLFL
jgi:chromosome segregation ATPase